MSTHSPHHAILASLLDKKQYEACKLAVEETITAEMARPEPGDRELAHLHIFLCRSLYGLHQYKSAGEKADIAVFLAQKLRDDMLLPEAQFRAGVCYGSQGDYPSAIERLTGCIAGGSPKYLAEALYTRAWCYKSMGAYSYAIPDYDAAIGLVEERDAAQTLTYRIGLAWVLILCQEFDRAEQVLSQLSSEPGAEADPELQLQIAHDRAHLDYMTKQGRAALAQALSALRKAGKDYAHVRAHIAVTLIGLAADKEASKDAFTLGVLAKRLAGEAHRSDLDREATRQMRILEHQTGTDCLVQALLEAGQVMPGVINRRRAQSQNWGSR